MLYFQLKIRTKASLQEQTAYITKVPLFDFNVLVITIWPPWSDLFMVNVSNWYDFSD